MHVIVQVQLPRHESAVAGLHGVTASVLAIHLLCTCLLRTFLFLYFSTFLFLYFSTLYLAASCCAASYLYFAKLKIEQ